MLTVAYVIAYLGIGVFLIASIARFFRWKGLPMHLRWELYPVAHEGSRAHYGGSYLENSEWWNKPREHSLFGTMKMMVPEILFLVAVKEHNPKLWTRSFPFHFGLYLVAAATGLMFVTAWLGRLTTLSPAVGTGLGYATLGLGLAGLVLGLLGALGLLFRRLGELRDYSSPSSIFNLLFFIVAFGVALGTTLAVDRDLAVTQAFVANLATFNLTTLSGTGAAPMLVATSAGLLALLLAYIPLTHMSHFIGKWFAYHAIRWNDTPNLQGGKEEPIIGELLGRPVTWSAPHIKGDGKRTWADVATEEVPK